MNNRSPSNLDNFTINTTEKAQWEQNRFHAFKKFATQKEFLASQISFFHAVQAFPRFLCLLASKIQSSEKRMEVVENIWEEHGNGDKSFFHTDTYMTYLKAIGYQGEKLEQNPWVTEWINNSLKMGMEIRSYQYASYLAGIEYIYARICADVVSYINTLKLSCGQTHYAKHAEIDWEHGKELFDVALAETNLDESYQVSELKTFFKQGQDDFLHMYNSIYMPTIGEMKEINKDPISFYYSRESSEVESYALGGAYTNVKDSPNILVICSGGEHVFEFMKHPHPLNITAIDINPHQIEVAKKKYDWLILDGKNKKIPEFMETNEFGKFEKVFAIFRSFFTPEEKSGIYENNTQDVLKMKYLVNVLFSNSHLNAVFGEAATMYTQESFSQHFAQVFLDTFDYSENTENIFTGHPIRDWKKINKEIKKHHSVHWVVGSPIDYSSENNFDIIDISNIGDWMPKKEFSKVIQNSYNLLNDGGQLITRKLLGDYNLETSLEKHSFHVEPGKDDTNFYSEVVIGIKQ